MMNLLTRFFITSLIVLAIFVLSAPIFALVWRSIEQQAWQFPVDEKVPQAVWLSFKTTAISLWIIVLLGTPLAYALDRWRFPARRLVSVLVELPIVMPPAVAGLGLLVALGRRGVIGAWLYETFDLRLAFTPAAVVIAQVFVAMPFYIRAAQQGFHGVDREVEQAALVDGASAYEQFWRVTVPLAGRSLLSGALMSWARALGEFGATIFFAGSLPGRTQTMPLLIYNIFERDLNAAIWTALILIGIAAVVVGVTQVIGERRPAP